MSSKPKTEYRVGVGASSILMVLVVLALTAVSLLSFGSARNHEVLTRRNLHMTTAYYEASAKAQQKLAAMDALLLDEAQTEGGELNEAAVRERLSQLDMDGLQIWRTQEGLAFSFSEDAGYERYLEVEGSLTLSGPQRCQIDRFQLVSQPAEGEFDEFRLLGG